MHDPPGLEVRDDLFDDVHVALALADFAEASSRTTEVVYRRELRPVLTTGAEVMDTIFKRQPSE